MDDDCLAAAAVPINKPKSPPRKSAPSLQTSHRSSTSLVDLCRSVIIANLERYPPDAFGICDPGEWQTIISLRHARTQPKKVMAGVLTSSGGLDGTGRLVPAVSEKVLLAVEECNPHLADCKVTDTLLWKDCVEYRFRRGGLTRPVALQLPWPLLVEQLQTEANLLLSSDASPSEIREAVDVLRRTPMNVSLLKDSGVGKIVKRAIKKATIVDAESKCKLEDLLSTWMEMAANSGVVSHVTELPAQSPAAAKHDDASHDDLQVAETCRTWRQLFAALRDRNEEIRTTQGKRMREIRKNVRLVHAA
jgi:hypothetical protein